ncbi:ATP-binding protein [Elizabethkingia anophelis]|uniref:ATP-binding protein n=2 Tax=Elizabethkingia anophelis TaxID=1117645 RepID=UPI0011782FA0|nr:ATP-binding protein [Elizabethkingia anophelis]
MRNAYSGYTYQKHVTLLLLSIMDVERNISQIEIETKIDDDFDDLIITTETDNYQFQIKDFEDITLKNLDVKENEIYIKGKAHKLSDKKNIIFFKQIDFEPNEHILDFPCYKFKENIFFVSLSRTQIHDSINNLYRDNHQRKNEIDSFFSQILDERKWLITRESLPRIKTFITELQEQSVSISHEILQFEKLLLIEGKPGVGKSHFVNTLTEEYPDNILYRFWIGNQDRDYLERLKYSKFIQDINIKLFDDLRERTEDVILQELQNENKTVIIDGLDHVENYNNSELDRFVMFINKLKEYCQVIILSRPLTKTLEWQKHILDNWNFEQTQKVLKELFHIDDYSTVDDIFEISQGYPIIVKYLAEHYKLHKKIPDISEVKDIDNYYEKIISDQKGKHSLSVFLCTSSYIMYSELDIFIGDEKYYVEEFIKEYPYLFDIKLNRISLFHDSFNTFLRKKIDYTSKKEKIGRIVTESILSLEKRFLSRFSMFRLSKEQEKKILIKYSSITTFDKIIKNTIDPEAISDFYVQLRERLKDINPSDLSVKNYYDLSLILNLIIREHISTLKTFYYTYTQSLVFNGITDEDITSSKHLFGMYYYIKTKNATLLYNTTANEGFSTNYFFDELEKDIYKEKSHIAKHKKKLTKSIVDKAFKDKINFREHLTYVIENFFIFDYALKDYEVLKSSIENYIKGFKREAIESLRIFLLSYGERDYYVNWMLEGIYENLLSYGYKIDNNKNEYQTLTLKKFICKYKNLGSFNLRDKIHNYIRLANLENRKIDINNIYPFWTKYYQRKDSSLYSLPIALHIFQAENIISLKDCIELIHEIQDVSEKGYRHLLADFIELYPALEIVPFLEKNFEIEDLHVNWFYLPVEYINIMSESTYNIQEGKSLGYNTPSSIALKEVENVLYSNKLKELKSTFNLFRISITYKESEKNKITDKLRKTKLRFEEITETNDYGDYVQTSQKRFDSGILTTEDIDFIKKKKLKSYDIAKFSNGYYASLSEVDIFKIYEPKEISYHFKKIIHNSLINKTKSIDYFYSLYYHPGNILAMIKQYRSDKEFKSIIKSFQRFIELSMFELKLNKFPN